MPGESVSGEGAKEAQPARRVRTAGAEYTAPRPSLPASRPPGAAGTAGLSAGWGLVHVQLLSHSGR